MASEVFSPILVGGLFMGITVSFTVQKFSNFLWSHLSLAGIVPWTIGVLHLFLLLVLGF